MANAKNPRKGVSRRTFIKGIGATTVSAAVSVSAAAARDLADGIRQLDDEPILGPGAVDIRFSLNGSNQSVQAEPSVTLLDLLRNQLGHTGAKEVCDRATCGACTVLLDGRPVYSCMKLAIEADNTTIKTVEGLAEGDQLSTLQEAFIEEDALQCGFCTSGFLVSLTAFLDEHPAPDEKEIREAVSGHICRCGTYPKIFRAALVAAGVDVPSQSNVIRISDDKQLA